MDLPFRMTSLTVDMRNRALIELGETNQVKEWGLQEIRAHVREQQNFECTDDDVFFLAFLRKGKYDMKRVIKLLQAYFKEKKNFPEIFSVPNVAAMRRGLEIGAASIIPHRDRDGSAVVAFRAENWDLNEFTFSTVVHFMVVTLLAAVEYEPSQVCGVKILLSTKGITLNYIRHIQLRYLTLLGRGIRCCIPVRIKGIHITNENVHVRFLWNLVSFYVGSKMRNRLHFHGTDYEKIQEFMDASVIPTDFGGEFKDNHTYGLSELDFQKELYVKRIVHSGYR